MATAGQAINAAAARLAGVGIDTAHYDARLLVAEVLGVEMRRLPASHHAELTGDEAARLAALLERRAAREPMSHILGRRGFWTLEFAVTADTLDPRPDTETLIEAVLDALEDRGRPRRLLDFGTGTGCILLTLLSELGHATGLGIDASPAALAVAGRNALSLGLAPRAEFRLGDWGEGLNGQFDVIVSNPPYIPDAEIDGLEPEVARYEPRSALAGGSDGLECYRRLIPHMARLLAPGGIAALEVGAGQAVDVCALLAAAGLAGASVRRDLGGIERCVIVRRIK
ncbi:peptide chain release factor N(5)-glutamine methyltransferase [Paramagnetospirillum magneticum]|uniref:Release factor glutamine methyltransferase n=1 Tax=Paramagnetospirillum magneticum (strain ATCC 700264 / AMB-1) TaxID=342108 RepID=Q2W6V2_PARM1|nr:peptide chain release factor N(5)-glutamine methyltransferase [Paramagnetospirillum magneticum]BAE50423.1 Methylase of polypeptide chain release factor [Paramagnetospirillum magneticum AMB-1]